MRELDRNRGDWQAVKVAFQQAGNETSSDDSRKLSVAGLEVQRRVAVFGAVGSQPVPENRNRRGLQSLRQGSTVSTLVVRELCKRP